MPPRRRSTRLAAARPPRLAARPPPNLPPLPHRRRRRRRPRIATPPPSPFVASGIFPLTSLPPELTLQIASYLTPRSVFALLLTSPAFDHLSSIFTILSRHDHTIYEHGLLHVYTPLQFFSSRGIESIVVRLLREGADPNDVSLGKPKCQLSPLIHAIGYHSASIVSLLLQHGAHVNSRDGWAAGIGLPSTARGYTPLHIAVGQPHHIHPQLCQDPQGYRNRSAELPQIVQLLLDAGADIEAQHPKRGTALHLACAARNANPLIVSTLIAAGADVSCRVVDLQRHTVVATDSNIQPIHYAASAGHAKIVRMLLDAGVDIEAKTRDGMRALDNAVITMRKEVLALLIEAGADAGTSTSLHPSLSAPTLSIAPGSRPMRKEVLRLLIAAGADSGVLVPQALRVNPFMLLERKVRWSELFWWLKLRGCRPAVGSLATWGITQTDLYKPRDVRCSAFGL